MSDPIFRPVVADVEEYRPGKNPVKPGVIKLASNENPFGPSPKALKAIAKEASSHATTLHMYPDQKSTELRNAIANKFGISSHNIICGNGSDDLMQIAGSTFICEGDEVLVSENSFSVYALVTRIFGGTLKFVPLKDFAQDVDALLAAITAKTKAIFLTSPHNPTGTYINSTALGAFISKVPENILIVIDEAYAEFAQSSDYPDSVKYVKDGKQNIFILRTFSKFYGLAGLRVGYGIASAPIVSAMLKMKMPFNVSRLAQAGALAALEDKAFLKKTYKNNVAGKKQLYKGLDALGLEYIKTEANFIFINMKKSADELFLNFMSEEVIIRPLTSFGFPEAIRVSVGTKAQNEKFLKALTQVIDRS